jgi:hypothetical protein
LPIASTRPRRRSGRRGRSAIAEKSRRDMLDLSISGHDPNRTEGTWANGREEWEKGLLRPP